MADMVSISVPAVDAWIERTVPLPTGQYYVILRTSGEYSHFSIDHINVIESDCVLTGNVSYSFCVCLSLS